MTRKTFAFFTQGRIVPKEQKSDETTRTSRHDYRLALQSAVSWLGERYLLAEPVARRTPR